MIFFDHFFLFSQNLLAFYVYVLCVFVCVGAQVSVDMCVCVCVYVEFAIKCLARLFSIFFR